MKKTFFSVITALFAVALFTSCTLFQSHKHAPITSGTTNLTLEGPAGKIMAILETPSLKEDQNCPFVILMHGFTSSKEDPICAKVASSLREKGIASIRFDFNGHGKSDGRFQDMTIRNEVQDAQAVYDYVSKLDYITKIGILGHSQGSLVCALFAPKMNQKIDAMVLMAPALSIPDGARAGRSAGASFDPNNVPENGVRIGNRILGKNYIVEAQQMNVWKEIKGFDKPVYLVRGTRDFVVSEENAKRIANTYADFKEKAYEGDDHGFSHNFAAACNGAADFLAEKLMKFK